MGKEHDEIVRRIKERNKRLSHSVWTDEPVLKPKKSVWLEDTVQVPEPEEEKAQEPVSEPEKSEPKEPVHPQIDQDGWDESEEKVLPLLHDKMAMGRREVSISFDETGKVRITEKHKKGKRRQVSLSIPEERAAEYRRRNLRNDKSSRRTLTLTLPVTRDPEKPRETDSIHTQVITPPVIRETSKGRNYEDPEFSVTPEAEEIAAAMQSEEEFVREYIPEKERLGRTIQQATARIKAMKAAGIMPEERTEAVRPADEDDLMGYEAAIKMLDEQIAEAERQLREEPEPEPVRRFERAPKPRFHKPEFEFVNALICVGVLAAGFLTAVTILAGGGVPKPSFRTWLSGNYSENVNDRLGDGEIERMKLAPPGETLDEMFALDKESLKEARPGGDEPGDIEESSETETLTEKSVYSAWNSRVFLVGEGEDQRGLCGFDLGFDQAAAYAREMSGVSESLPQMDVYVMTVPLASAYYLPESLGGDMTDQELFIDSIGARLTGAVNVDIYGRLQARLDDGAYLRTDHRWAPLGAYYAGQVFTEHSGADYPELSECESVTMDGYAGDLCSVKGCEELAKHPESFTYYKYGTSAEVTLLSSELEALEERELFPEGMGPFELAGGESGCFRVQSGGEDRVLALVTDEFGRQLTPFLTAGYGDIWVIDRSLGLDPEVIAEKTGCTEMLFVSSVYVNGGE